ncbi:2-keto-4-pentenoate hydratase/2-oxohepta-3-ene-1,7-dioic acid hydratase (catechol pathway) [Variovorax sp. HW608]|uniref:fumarylacetoacetate hydrolase family protein n=1 Tax=Variovorax sp. HW608 TaxID=1034889 RepID=UPI00081FB659|nr:fumarylacetoacetate hydrolase family protein [Variovorax sp. HW608]SCK14980.1 2-keto-4-pentenoate hydratase/2-oxohepta-3-ene-1,7-dioic acid hydratase (catechol pathway) [Variovorax sp. HW608]
MQGNYKLVTYSTDKKSPRAGIVVNEQVFDAEPAVADRSPTGRGFSVQELLENWAIRSPMLSEYAAAMATRPVEGVPLAGVQLHAPVLPGAIYCAGANYHDHVEEMVKALEQPLPPDVRAFFGSPWFFIKPSRTCVVAPQGTTVRPVQVKALDWEAELAVVIGKTARSVSESDALQYVAGYTIANDLSARDQLKRANMPAAAPFHYDWVSHKAFEGSCPLGPWITPVDQVADPQSLGIRLHVNGVIKQDSNTSQMIFPLAELIAYISKTMTLYPGDVILTGTPAGVGAARREFLAPGDHMRVEIDGLGVLESSIS